MSRLHSIPVRLSATEREHIEHAAWLSGLTLSAFLRSAAMLEATRLRTEDPDDPESDPPDEEDTGPDPDQLGGDPR